MNRMLYKQPIDYYKIVYRIDHKILIALIVAAAFLSGCMTATNEPPNFRVTSLNAPDYHTGDNITVAVGLVNDGGAGTLPCKVVATIFGQDMNKTFKSSKDVTLSHNETEIVQFDMGGLPAGVYIVSVVVNNTYDGHVWPVIKVD